MFDRSINTSVQLTRLGGGVVADSREGTDIGANLRKGSKTMDTGECVERTCLFEWSEV